MSDLMKGLAALDEARPAYEKAQLYYEGNASEKFTSEALRRALGSQSSEFNFNYARLVVQARLSRMEVSSITSQDGSADDALADIWNRNALDQELQDAFEGCLTFGDAYLLTSISEDGADIFYNSPLDTRVFYKAENPRQKSYAIKRWLEDGKLRVNLYYADRIERWVTRESDMSNYQEDDFVEYEPAETNETGAVPVFHLRTSRMYGTPVHEQAYGPQNALNKLISSQVSNIDFSSAPQRYFLEDPAANEGVNPAADFGVVDDDDNDTDKSSLKSNPGGVWSLKGIKEVGQFQVASPDTFTEPFNKYIEGMSTTTATPMHAFNVGALPSGESLRAAEAPLNKHVESMELMLGATLRELHEYTLDALGFGDVEVIVGWAPAATYDDADVWTNVQAKNSAGVPLRVALLEAGYTEEQVSEWYPTEERAPRTATELAKLADAIQKIGASVSLGLLTKEEARRLLPEDVATASEVADPEVLTDAVSDLEVLIAAGVDPAEAEARVGTE